MTGFSREGLYRNGLFPNASFGKSDAQKFATFSFKGGATFKLDGRSYFFANALLSQEAPQPDNTFISPRTRNTTVENPTTEKMASAEAGYVFRAPKSIIRAVGYATDIRDATDIRRFYSDFGTSFINYVMQGVSTRNIGLELSAQAKLNASFSVTGAAAISQAFYTANPSQTGMYSDDDSSTIPVSRQVFIKNYYLGVGPQSAYNLGLGYSAKNFWFARASLSYFDRNYAAINPDRRSEQAVAGVPVGSGQYQAIINQEMLPAFYTVDLLGGASLLLSRLWKGFPRGTFLYVNVGVSNLLDATIRTGGFEQLRYDFRDNNPAEFAPKYFYGLGRNFFVNVSLKF